MILRLGVQGEWMKSKIGGRTSGVVWLNVEQTVNIEEFSCVGEF